MYSLVNVCTNDYAPIWNVVGIIIKVIWIGVPIALIVLGSIDLGKAVISSKEDEVKKAKKALLNRFLYAVLVFCVVWIVTLVMGAISKIGINDTDTTSWSTCWDLIMKS
ncbi:MAG: hypothetical protein PUH84_04425 [Firmicutes bacterium]|nr:hypothetical protein [Bacillota bacterium]MDY5335132.1 hypothetical protein [Bacilli bacterium]